MTKAQDAKIAEYQKMVKADFVISEEKLDIDSLASVAQHAKYVGFMIEEKRELSNLYKQRKKIESLKYDYYSGRLDSQRMKNLGWTPFPNKILKSEIQTYVERDNDMINLNHTVELQESIVEFLELTIKGIANRNWSIKNAIEYRKFLHGNG